MSAPRPTEAQCQTTIVHVARLAGWLVHHTRPAQNGAGVWRTPLSGDRGFVDLVLAHPGRRQCVLVELKRKPNKVEPEQQRWLDALRACGLDTRVWWVPDELDAALAFLMGGRCAAR